jgi:DNA-binding HxlR family transcriptional regulator
MATQTMTCEDDHMREVSSREEAPVCEHFQRAAELLGRRWNPQIVRALLSGASRFTELRTAVPGLSDHLLSERLKEFEAAELVIRTVTPSTPVRIEYHLTERGHDLERVIEELAGWAERWGRASDPPRAQPRRRG